MAQATFAPWRADLKTGLLTFLIGAGLLVAGFMGQSLGLGMGGFVLAWFGWGRLQRGLSRRRGKTVEVSAVKKLKMPSGWRATPNRSVHTGGDVDVVLESPQEKEFAVEIKSYEGIQVVSTWLGFGDPKFLRINGKPFDRDPVAQTMRNAEALKAVPVLWLPNGDGKTIKLRSGLIIVQGGHRRLLRAVGATPWYWPF